MSVKSVHHAIRFNCIRAFFARGKALVRALFFVIFPLFLLCGELQARTEQPKRLSVVTRLEYELKNEKQPDLTGLDFIELNPASSQSSRLRFMKIANFGQAVSISKAPQFSVTGSPTAAFASIPEELLESNNITLGRSFFLQEISLITEDMLLIPYLEAPLSNKDGTKIESVLVKVRLNGLVKIASASNDFSGLNDATELLLRIYETGTNSGIFAGFVQFSAGATPSNITGGRVRYPVLAGGNKSLISASYVEGAENNAVTQSTVRVDIARSERGKVFDSVSGRLINGVSLSLVDEKTGQIAKIYGDDGVAVFPSVIKSGGKYQDSSGKRYQFKEGNYYFPSVPPGKYRLSVGDVPNNYIFPSTLNKKKSASLSAQKLDGDSIASGKSFSLFFDSVIAQDIPLDPRASLALEKIALQKTASAGDLIPYEVKLNNSDIRTGRNLIFYDRLPPEMRLIKDSVTLNGVKFTDIQFDSATGNFSFALPDMKRGDDILIRYATRVTAAPVKENRVMRNEAYVVGSGGFVTNVATAEVVYKDDLLQANGTVLGRVIFDDCKGNFKDKKANVKDIVGLPKARLFLQDGTQVVTDEYGKFSIPNVKPGRHVLQLDRYALPKGVESVLCKNNTRHAGTAFSRFIDVTGGFVYKANFSLSGDKEKFRPVVKKPEFDPSLTPEGQEQPAAPGQWGKNTPIGYFNAEWLDMQDPSFQLVYPGKKFNPSIKSLNFGVKYPSGHTVKAYINDEPVSQLNLETVFADKKNTVRMAHWRGADLNRDVNTLKIILSDENKKQVQMITHDIFFNQKVYKVDALPNESVLRADGLSQPELTFLLSDKNGSPIGAGTPVRVSIEAPYAFDRRGLYQKLGDRPNAQNGGDTQEIYTEADGKLVLHLQPTTQSGRATARVYLTGGDYREYDFWLKPEKREWILVGLADGTIGHKTVADNMKTADLEKIEKGFNNNGKVAFYTKGVISEDWLVTAAFDSSKRKSTERERIFQTVDPTKTYPVLGDQSSVDSDAPSQYPLYVKVEKERFYALFGDYDTGFNESKLAGYSRRMSGFKTVYREDDFTVTGFASEDGQIYFKDEIRSDGTSGPYKLRAENILVGSDRISVEVRDRIDRNKILETRFLSRFLDYDLDYQDGVLTFRLPIAETDGAFNPQFIIVDYETAGPNVTNKSFGARAEQKFPDQDTKIGVTALRDGGGDRSNKTDLLAADVKVKLTDTLNLEAEIARTNGVGGPLLSANGVNAANGEKISANAVRTELKHEGENLYSNLYYEKKENGFGVAGTTAFGSASQAFGAETVYDFSRKNNEKSGVTEAEKEFDLSDGASVYAKVRREQDELDRGDLSVAELGARKEIDNYSFYTGLRAIKENISFNYVPINGTELDNFSSNGTILQWMNGIESEVIRDRLSLFASSETPISSDGESALYGNRNLVGGNLRASETVRVTSAYQWADIGGEDYQSALGGLEWSPLTNTSFNFGADQHLVGAQEFSSGTAGVLQTVPITKNTALTLGAEHKEALSGNNGSFSDLIVAPQDMLPSFVRDGAITGPFNNSGELWESRNTFTAGIGHNQDGFTSNLITQYRDSDSERRLNLNGSVIGDTAHDLALGFQAGYQKSSLKNDLTIDDYLERLRNGSLNREGTGEYYSSREARFIKDSSVATLSSGAAYRPLDEDGPIILHRADLQMLKNETEEDIFKLINNLAVQADLTDKLETNAQYAIKYVEDHFNGNSENDIVQVIGNETRYDIREDVDIGIQGVIRNSAATNSNSYSVGASAGYTPAKNVYIQAGYNIVGFRDRDFSLLGYTAQGPYLRVSAKFDQDSLKDNVGDLLGR